MLTTQVKRRNERLAEAMARMHVSSADVAAEVGVDPRTVDRWVEDDSRIPRAQYRHVMGRLVEMPVGALWPSVATGPQVSEELVAVKEAAAG